MTREEIIETYMINSKKVIAEMLHDTIEKYENRICKNCKHWDGESLGSFYCPELNYWVEPENFGCTEFKRITDE